MSKKKEDPCFGVKCMTIGGRTIHERERCMGMTDEERRWRYQFLKDQVIPEGEPRFVPEYYRDTTNIFRRLYVGPRMKFEEMLRKFMNPNRARLTRSFIGKNILLVGFCYFAWYNLKYNSNNWARKKKIHIHHKRTKLLPGDPGYPHFEERSAQFYTDHGFSKSPFYKN